MIDTGTIALIASAATAALAYIGSRSKVPMDTVMMLKVQISSLEARIISLEQERTQAEKRIVDKDAIIRKLEADIERLRDERDDSARAVTMMVAKNARFRETVIDPNSSASQIRRAMPPSETPNET